MMPFDIVCCTSVLVEVVLVPSVLVDVALVPCVLVDVVLVPSVLVELGNVLVVTVGSEMIGPPHMQTKP